MPDPDPRPFRHPLNPDPTLSTPAPTPSVNGGPTEPAAGDELPNFAPPEQPDELGRLGGYRVLRLLGKGGMGAVFAAEDVALRRPVALKTMTAAGARSEAARERFLREARAAARVESDHIVRVYQVGHDRGVPYIAMEFLRGKPLDAWMREYAATVPHALRVGYETALGLAAAHEAGLVHRDIKPGNLWLEAPHGRVKILDFGLARTGDDANLTGTGVVLGTPAYMAPEQARGRGVDFRSDLFSLGCVLYHLATGQRPFSGPDTLAVLTSLAVDTPPPPHTLNPAVPPHLSDLIGRLLAKDPAFRPGSAAAVAEELRWIQKGTEVSAVPAAVLVPAPAAPAETLWEDIAVSAGPPPGTDPSGPTMPLVGLSRSHAALPNHRPAAWPVYAAVSGAVAVALVAAVFVWQAVSRPPKPTGTDEQPEVVKRTPPPSRPRATPKAPPKPAFDPADLVPVATPVVPEKVFSLDHLDAKEIPPEERFPGQPKGLVAVIGTRRLRMNGPVTGMWMTRDGTTVSAAAGYEQRRAWDVATRKEIPFPRRAERFTPDGKAANRDNKVWSLADPTGTPVEYPIQGYVQQFLTDRVALARLDGDVIVWRLDEVNPRPIGKFANCRGAYGSADGKRVAVLPVDPEAGVAVYEVTETAVTKTATLPGPKGVGHQGYSYDPPTVSLVGDRMAVTAPDHTIRVWDLGGEEPAVVASLPQPAEPLWAVALTAGGERVVAWHGGFFEVLAVDGDKLKRVARCPQPKEWFAGDGLTAALAVTPDGKTVVAGYNSGAVRFWPVENDVVLERDLPTAQPSDGGDAGRRVAVSPDGRTFTLRAESGELVMWDLTAPAPRRLPAPDDFRLYAVWPPSPDGRRLAGLPWNKPAGQGIQLWEVSPAGPVRQVAAFGLPCWKGGFSPDGKSLVALDDAKDLVVWDVAGAEPKERYRAAVDDLRGVAMFVLGGQYVVGAQGGFPGGFGLWAVTTKGLVERDRVSAPAPFHALVPAPDGKSVAAARDDGLQFFDLAGGEIRPRPGTSPGQCVSLDYAPDGKSVVVGRGDRVQFIDPADGRTTREYTFPAGVVHAAWHPDGRHLLVLNADRTVYVVRVADRADGPK